MLLCPASITRSNTKFRVASRKGSQRRLGTTASCSAVSRAVGTSELRTNSIVDMR